MTTENDIERVEIARELIEEPVDTSTGLSSQGIVNEIALPGGGVQSFFLEKGQEIPRKYKKLIVENAELNLKSIPKQHRAQLQANIASWRKELGLK